MVFCLLSVFLVFLCLLLVVIDVFLLSLVGMLRLIGIVGNVLFFEWKCLSWYIYVSILVIVEYSELGILCLSLML